MHDRFRTGGRATGISRANHPFAFAALLFTLVATPALADSFDSDRIAERIRAGEEHEAYKYALAHRAEHEGDPSFDFWYGVAALDVGEISEGIFALERVHLQQPGSARVRLELGRGYFLAGEDRRARRHFEAVLERNPPAPVAAAIRRYLYAMQQRADRYTTVVTGFVELGGGYDTNVNSATDAAEFELFGVLPVELADENRAQSDDFTRAAVGAELRRPLTPETTFWLAGDLQGMENDEHSEFDSRVAEARAGTVFHHREDVETRLGVRLQRFEVGGEPYRDLAGIDLNINRRASPHLHVFAGFQLAHQEYEDQETRDALLATVSAGVTRVWQAALRPVTSFGVFVGREEPDEDTSASRAVAERRMGGVSAKLRLRVIADWFLHAGLQYRRSDYGAEHALLGATREENYHQAELTLEWQPDTHWRIGPRLRHSVNDANTALHEYERSVLELRVRYGFH